MVNVKFIQVYINLVELSRKGEMLWRKHSVAEFEHLDPEAVMSAVYKATYKGKDIIIYQQRVSFNRGITLPETVCDFVDENNNKLGEMPRAQGINDLYREAMMQNRDPQIVELDKVVAALTEMTRTGKVEWTVQAPKDFEDLDDEFVSPSVYQLDYRGRRFIVFRELLIASGNGVDEESRASLWSVDARGRRVSDLVHAQGVEKLYATVATRLQKTGVEMSKLDIAVDQMVAASIKQVVEVLKAEKARQAAKQAAAEAAQKLAAVAVAEPVAIAEAAEPSAKAANEILVHEIPVREIPAESASEAVPDPEQATEPSAE